MLLPPGVAKMVDDRCRFSGLKYPSADMFFAFVLVEHIYASLATAENFQMFGGDLLQQITSVMIANESIFSRLANLFDGEKFSEDEISASV